ncbi:hypothetical protein C8R44DRAFT_894132 [Mycena epipterygia]|nr:hypothetical protein C8R44DRAFT_894132 [Mycena epipterygia]
MFAKFSAVVTSVLITFAIAIPNTTPPVTIPSSAQCCNSVQPSNSSAVAAVADLLNITVSGLNVPIGLGCTPIIVANINCVGIEVTCDVPKKEFGGLIAINCTSIVV